MRKIELLAPARDLASGIAAIDHGADAVYIGGSRFGARYAASNTTDDIARLCDYARPYGARVYATMNTILYPSELAEAEHTARELIAAGVDALIVQDMAFMRMGLTGVEMHASTQVCNMTPEGARFLQESGFARVILERNLTFDDVRAIRTQSDVELEFFVHGAICVGYSGRCYLSRTLGNRSGNRGECLQPCRLPYDLEVDGRILASGKHLLSVRDMNLSGRIAELMDAGVDSFKIEGRLKDETYIKNIVSWYRNALDRAMEGRADVVRRSVGHVTREFEPDPAKSFTRGFTEYFVDGKCRGVASFDTPKAVGELVGTVERIDRDFFILREGSSLAPGDGICFLNGGTLTGTNINRVEGVRVWPNRMDGVIRGAEVFRNYDNRFVTALARSRTRRRIDVGARIRLKQDGISLRLADEQGVAVECEKNHAFEEAKNPAKMVETIRAQVAKSGDTVFNVTSVEVEPGKVFFVPSSELNALRREALDELLKARMSLPADRSDVRENKYFPFPHIYLDGHWNVVNPLAEQFYRDHGVVSVDTGLDLKDEMYGECVMETSYCIRREIRECLLEKSTLKGDLMLRHGVRRYRLEFDCSQCRMKLIFEKNI